MSTMTRLALAATISSLLLAACAHHPTTRPQTASSQAIRSHTNRGSVSGSATSTSRHSPTQRRAEPTDATSQAENTDSERTGIAACDDYLASYMACHRAAAIYTPEQLPLRYQALRTTLLRDSKNPKIRPNLAARCNSLARTLRDSLHGKSCDTNPAISSSSP